MIASLYLFQQLEFKRNSQSSTVLSSILTHPKHTHTEELLKWHHHVQWKHIQGIIIKKEDAIVSVLKPIDMGEVPNVAVFTR